MKVDYHLHLEEGPYSLRWLDRTNRALPHFMPRLENMKVFSYRPDENTLLSYYERIAKTLLETNVATEVNAGLYYRDTITKKNNKSNTQDRAIKNNPLA